MQQVEAPIIPVSPSGMGFTGKVKVANLFEMTIAKHTKIDMIWVAGRSHES